MTQLHAINKNGKMIIVSKDSNDESKEHFVSRCWWIAKQVCNNHKKETKSLQQIENESHIWSCIVHHGVSYNDDIMNNIQ